MARRTVVVLTDDLTGEESPSIRTVAFSFDGASYEIDLAKASVDQFAEALAPYIKAGRRVGGVKRAAGQKSDSDRLAAIREWANSQGIEVAQRGRIKAEVVEAYEAAH